MGSTGQARVDQALYMGIYTRSPVLLTMCLYKGCKPGAIGDYTSLPVNGKSSTMTRLSPREGEYNGLPVYQRQGGDNLYIYYFTSDRDSLSLWVIKHPSPPPPPSPLPFP